ncbi:MAG: site-2 protease family protein [Candidatus Omnitrophica bacterium]|nr:site-2 protease family protein [Candidatus Omnitrophota bacterium]
MYSKRFKLFKLFGFSVYIDLSWLIIAVLIIWSLATGIFPFYFKDLSTQAYWIMGIVGAIGLFASIVFHEFAHSLVAQKRGMSMKGITLFIFGGVAEMSDEPPDASSEFWMAVAGPLASVFLAAGFFGLELLGKVVGWSVPVVGVLAYLAWINCVLVVFNLLPAFPLDGGRVLRSLLWARTKNLRRATRTASWLGMGFGIILMGLGILNFLFGSIIGGIWWFLLGLFLRQAARTSYQQLLMRQALEGEPVRRFMHADPITVSPSVTVREFVENYVYRYQYKLYPVVNDGQLLGCVSVKQIKEIPRTEWDAHTVGELAANCSDENTIAADADAVQALAQMNRGRLSRLIVIDRENHLAGVLVLKDLLNFLSLKVELEGT